MKRKIETQEQRSKKDTDYSISNNITKQVSDNNQAKIIQGYEKMTKYEKG